MKIKILMKQAIIVAIALVSLSLAGCKKSWWDSEEGKNGGGGGGKGKPTVKGTMVTVLCGVSIYNNLWIKTDDGTLLQPAIQTTNNVIHLVEGDRVEIVYSLFKGASPLDDKIVCLAALPPHERVAIHSIAKINTGNSCTPIAIIPNGYKPGDTENKSIYVKSAAMNGSCLELNISYSGCNMHTESIKLISDGELNPTFGKPTYLAELVDTEYQMCEALFSDKVSFDISALKTAKGTFYIKIAGYDELIAITK
jgi:hypothetical protein